MYKHKQRGPFKEEEETTDKKQQLWEDVDNKNTSCVHTRTHGPKERESGCVGVCVSNVMNGLLNRAQHLFFFSF